MGRGYSAAPEGVAIGVDVNPTGNSATSLGSIDSCVSVSTGDTFEVDIFVRDVRNLLAWEVYFFYDISVVNVDSTDVMMFQAANAGSNVWDASEALPDIDGQYGIGAVDLADPPALDSGSGVLARLTLKAVGPGVSTLSLSAIDINGDGSMDLGPWLKDGSAEPIGDSDGDGFFDGPIANAQVAVDTDCPGGPPPASPTSPAASPTPTAAVSPSPEQTPGSPTPGTTPTPTMTATASVSPTPGGPSSTEDKGSAWTGTPAIIGYVLGGLAAVLLGGAATFAVVRRRAR
ncbi:MAG: hypothetical protein ACUVX1_02820 [Chloroflexota bacterium]